MPRGEDCAAPVEMASCELFDKFEVSMTDKSAGTLNLKITLAQIEDGWPVIFEAPFDSA